MLWLCIRLPALVREALAAGEREAIERLAAWAYQWSSLVTYRLSDGGDAPLLWLELGASTALFGGHAALLARIEDGLAQLGYSHRCALAPSPAAAALLSRAPEQTERCVFTRAQLRTQLAPLPLSLLEQPAEIVAALQSAGLRCIGEVLALPAAALARRFGPQCCRYLARLTGEASDPRPAWRLPAVYRARCEFEQDVHDTTALLFALQRLLQEFQGYLRARDRSVQRFTLELEHHSAAARVTRVPIGLSAPSRDAARFLLLARERLQGVALAAPIRALQLSADQFTAPAVLQADLFGSEAQQLGELSHLLDRLRARLGGQAVHSYRCQADHRPERAWSAVQPEQASAAMTAVTAMTAHEPSWRHPARPAALLPSPQRIAPPRQILSGPERIESGWWDGGDAVRDYYVARADDGARQWVFRDPADGSWYLQGLWV
ncbi:MAG TPA: DNA polymerase Y family protein [Steroidobacteraceae bacterium]|jgi:protein ImuB|nr:DNA polymerase Y family protein [Steroidobacteraceae bacterium]